MVLLVIFSQELERLLITCDDINDDDTGTDLSSPLASSLADILLVAGGSVGTIYTEDSIQEDDGSFLN
jgi:hypothetical protein